MSTSEAASASASRWKATPAVCALTIAMSPAIPVVAIFAAPVTSTSRIPASMSTTEAANASPSI